MATKKSKRRKRSKLNPKAQAFFAKAGRKGARKLHKSLTPEQRSANARKAAQARWKKPEE